MEKKYKTKIEKSILDLAKNIKVEIRVADSLKKAKITWLPEEANKHLALYTNRIIFVKSKTKYKPKDLNLIILHEIGHVFVQHHQLMGFKIDNKTEEISANCIAFSLAYLLGLEVTDYMIEQFNAFNDLKF